VSYLFIYLFIKLQKLWLKWWWYGLGNCECVS